MLIYKENNIEFRTASAAAIGEFKLTQANAFLQVSRREFEFDRSAKEVVLLSYDRLGTWLFRMERAFLLDESKIPSPSLKETTINTLTEELLNIEEICLVHSTIFTRDILSYLQMIHGYSKDELLVIINNILTLSTYKAFTKLCQVIGDYLQHILIAMHEYNNNLVKRNNPFICITPFSVTRTDSNFIGIRKRTKYFRKILGDCVFEIKNYSNEEITDSVVDRLREMDICVNKEVLESDEPVLTD